MAVLGLRFCTRTFSSCGKRGPLFIAVRRPLTIVASLVAEHRLQTRRLSNCGSRAQSLRGTWDPPRQGPEPVSPALAGRLSTTAPPGKPSFIFLELFLNQWHHTIIIWPSPTDDYVDLSNRFFGYYKQSWNKHSCTNIDIGEHFCRTDS